MSIEDLRRFRNAVPFVPFDILLRAGGRVHVSVPERMALAPDGELVAVYQESMPEVIPIAQIERLENRPGKRRPRRP